MSLLDLLPSLHFELRVSNDPLFKVLPSEQQKLKEVTRKAGATSPAFHQAYEDMYSGIANQQSLASLLTNVLRVRAYGIGVGGAPFRRVPLSDEALTRINHFRPIPSRQFMENLFDWYCGSFDEMSNQQGVRQWLIRAIAKRPEYQHWLVALVENAPKSLANDASDLGISLKEHVKRRDLEKIIGGRLYSAAQNIFYLESLKKLKPNEESTLLGQLVLPEVFNSAYTPEVPLGVEVMRILIDRLPATEELGDSWRAVINSIGGDPRLPDTSPIYRKWWKPLGRELIEKARGWYSRMDLKIFLRVIEEHGKASYDEDMQRMFPARKRFLEGLFDNGFVKGSRLYLSRGAARYVRRHIHKDDLPKFDTVRDQDKSIIYLDLGDIHLVEGSHNCKLWLHQNLAPNTILRTYSTSQPSYFELTQGIVSRDHIAITHTPNTWITNALEAMRYFGISVSAEQVMSKKDAKSHIRRLGY
ncbi:EH_Signature domain-containing protein [Ferrimonas sediminum]|uniref:EH_Signature domain-containing protein n=1 Tax=Ferrimonas sediminum TaxID=718193 RepID=A0A1G8UX42_9GAMM|nr:EH signature domain-containing protein [Ferrimonas sediminum]SDJ58204.1 EH_Signature domain-containing protein [Ferrimonas sediminum]